MLNRTTLSRIIYVSQSVPPRDGTSEAEQISKIVRSSRRQNEFMLITSSLVFTSGRFLHVFEGDREAINKCFQRITADPRHTNIRIVEWREIAKRDLQSAMEIYYKTEQTKQYFDTLSIDQSLARNIIKPSNVMNLVFSLQRSARARAELGVVG